MKVHLVDGTFELFRCYHGAPRAQVGGREVGAVRGLVQTLVALLRQPEVTHVAVAFDRGLSPPGADPMSLPGQFTLATDATRALGLVVWPMIRFQADEILASGAVRYKDQVDQVVICTTDKDLYQVVDLDRVVCLDRIRKRVIDQTAVEERFGIPPSLIPDLFALVGDPSDGLPGLPGWGQKGASQVLAAFGSLEDIPLDPEAWPKVRGKQRLAKILTERRTEALFYKALSHRRRDVPLVHGVDDLRWVGVSPDLPEILTLIGDDSVLARIPENKENL